MLNISVLTLFPNLFPGPLGCSVLGRALDKNLWSLRVVDIRDYATDARKKVDDVPYGGGAGMIMKPDVLAAAIEGNISATTEKLLYMSPRGRVFDQQYAKELSAKQEVMVICGRFEGIDQRVLEYFPVEEVSVGDYILSGGELAAMVVIDACVRNINGVLNNSDSLDYESFSCCGDNMNLLEYHQYTRPAVWRDIAVPSVLLSGNHAQINNWRLENAKSVTRVCRSDLWDLFLKRKNNGC